MERCNQMIAEFIAVLDAVASVTDSEPSSEGSRKATATQFRQDETTNRKGSKNAKTT
jgi:hypothetical protein